MKYCSEEFRCCWKFFFTRQKFGEIPSTHTVQYMWTGIHVVILAPWVGAAAQCSVPRVSRHWGLWGLFHEAHLVTLNLEDIWNTLVFFVTKEDYVAMPKNKILPQNFCQCYLPLCMMHTFRQWSDFGRNYVIVGCAWNSLNAPEVPQTQWTNSMQCGYRWNIHRFCLRPFTGLCFLPFDQTGCCL